MPKLSTRQIRTLDEFRHTHAGPLGLILEDDQGYDSLIGHLINEPADGPTFLQQIERRRLAKCINGGGNGSPERVDLHRVVQTYQWCFVVFQATIGRDDIAEQLDQLLDDGSRLTRLILVNYDLDHRDAHDDLRRLFAMVPTVALYFADATHLFEIDADEFSNPSGARRVAELFAHMRRVGLPPFVVTYREFRRSVEELGDRQSTKDVVTAVRARLAATTEVMFARRASFLPPRQEFWQLFDRSTREFQSDSGRGLFHWLWRR